MSCQCFSSTEICVLWRRTNRTR